MRTGIFTDPFSLSRESRGGGRSLIIYIDMRQERRGGGGRLMEILMVAGLGHAGGGRSSSDCSLQCRTGKMIARRNGTSAGGSYRRGGERSFSCSDASGDEAAQRTPSPPPCCCCRSCSCRRRWRSSPGGNSSASSECFRLRSPACRWGGAAHHGCCTIPAGSCAFVCRRSPASRGPWRRTITRSLRDL